MHSNLLHVCWKCTHDTKDIEENSRLRRDKNQSVQQRCLRAQQSAGCCQSHFVMQIDDACQTQNQQHNVHQTFAHHSPRHMLPAHAMHFAILHGVQCHVRNNQNEKRTQVEHRGNQYRQHHVRGMECGRLIMRLCDAFECEYGRVHVCVFNIITFIYNYCKSL